MLCCGTGHTSPRATAGDAYWTGLVRAGSDASVASEAAVASETSETSEAGVAKGEPTDGVTVPEGGVVSDSWGAGGGGGI